MVILLDSTLLFFAFGMFAGLVRSNLEIPAQAAKALSQLMLISLGLKGGFALAKSGFDQQVLSGLDCALGIPLWIELARRYLAP
jgi:hypothetical protein